MTDNSNGDDQPTPEPGEAPVPEITAADPGLPKGWDPRWPMMTAESVRARPSGRSRRAVNQDSGRGR
jgi:hypothetical protein